MMIYLSVFCKRMKGDGISLVFLELTQTDRPARSGGGRWGATREFCL